MISCLPVKNMPAQNTIMKALDHVMLWVARIFVVLFLYLTLAGIFEELPKMRVTLFRDDKFALVPVLFALSLTVAMLWIKNSAALLFLAIVSSLALIWCGAYLIIAWTGSFDFSVPNVLALNFSFTGYSSLLWLAIRHACLNKPLDHRLPFSSKSHARH